jgi:hypothetical protein
VHAKDAAARQWYLHWEFEPSPSDPLHLFLLIKDIKAMVGPKPRLKAQGCERPKRAVSRAFVATKHWHTWPHGVDFYPLSKKGGSKQPVDPIGRTPTHWHHGDP